MSTFSVSVRYRPFRVGFCIPDEDKDAMRTAIRLATCLWGGGYSPIIPCNDSRVVRDIVTGFRLDGLMPLCDGEAVSRVISEYPHLPSPEFHQKVFIGGGDGPVPTLLSARRAIDELYNEHFRGNSDPDKMVHILKWDDDDPFSDVFLAMFGGYPDPETTGHDFAATLQKRLRAKDVQLEQAADIELSTLDHPGPLELTTFRLEPRYDVTTRSYGGPGVFIGDPSSFSDVVAFWNLRAAGYSVVFVAEDTVNRTKDIAGDLCKRIVESATGPHDWRAQPHLWTQKYRGPITIPELPFNWVNCSVSDARFGGYHIDSPQMTFASSTVLAHYQEGSPEPVAIPLPDKPWQEDEGFSSEYLVASILPYGGPSKVLVPPFVPELNLVFGRALTVDPRKVRAEPESVGVVIRATSSDISLFPMEQIDLIAAIFKHAGLSITPSQAGKITTTMIKHLGGLQSCRAFKIAGLRNLIFKHKHDQSFAYATAQQTMKRGWKDIYTRFHATKPKGNQPTHEDILDFSIDKGIFRLGVELKCGSCQIGSWWSIDDVKTTVDCPWCGEPVKAAVQLPKPKWKLRLSGIFAHSDHLSGGIPVIMVLQQVDTALHFDKLKAWSTGIDIEGPGVKCESDLVLLTHDMHHDPIIVIGECKNLGPIDAKDVENLTSVAKGLEAKGFRTAIIFAKLGSFSPDEIDLCRRANEEFRHRTILLSERELEPFWMYEDIPPEELKNHHADSIDDMISATLKTYLKPAIPEAGEGAP